MSVAVNFKTALVRALLEAMKEKGVTQSELARRMKTSRAVVYRLLLKDDLRLTLNTMAKAAEALGVRMIIRVG